MFEIYLDCNKDEFMCFIDYKNAFDRVNYLKMIECLKEIYTDGKDRHLIMNLYWNQKVYIRTDEGLSSEVLIRGGVRQGCIPSCCLFNLYTEDICPPHFPQVGIHS